MLGKLVCLKYLYFTGLPETYTSIDMKGIKCLNKGFLNLIKNGGKLNLFSIHNINFSGNANEIVDKIFSPLC